MKKEINRDINDYITDFVFQYTFKRKLKHICKHVLDVITIILPIISGGFIIYLLQFSSARELMSTDDQARYTMQILLLFICSAISSGFFVVYFSGLRDEMFK